MAVIVSNIKTPVDAPVEEAYHQAAKRVGLGSSTVGRAYVVKCSVDARRQERIRLVYSIGLELPPELEARFVTKPVEGVSVRRREALCFSKGGEVLRGRPVVVGFGPGGMFAALMLARNGYRPLVLERGAALEERITLVQSFWRGGALDVSTNVQFGEGGAGTFSDGKLVTRIHDPRCEAVLEEFVNHGAPEEILQKAKPHVGTDKLRQVVMSMREEILRLGGEIRFLTKMEQLLVQNGRLVGVKSSQGEVESGAVILAIGHSARDSFAMLAENEIRMEPKAFSVGVRVEHLQDRIDTGLYGGLAGHPNLPRGEYQLSLRQGNQAVYTFCMCPGGVVVPAASEQETVVTNGMSEFARDGKNANSALVVSVDQRDFGSNLLDGMAFQRRLERLAFLAGGNSGKAPAQDAGSFLAEKPGLRIGRVEPSFVRGVEAGDFSQIFSSRITGWLREGLETFHRRLPGFGDGDTLLTGVETRTSSPVRICRGEGLESETLPGLYPCGEGAGYAGGITSAAVDGIRVAQAVMARFAPPKC